MINSSFLLKWWTIKAFVDYPQCVNKCPVWPETSTVTKANKMLSFTYDMLATWQPY